jgi:hypothetical protein
MTARLAAVSLVPFLELLMSRANPVRQLVTRAVDDSEAIWRIERKPLPCVGELGVSTLSTASARTLPGKGIVSTTAGGSSGPRCLIHSMVSMIHAFRSAMTTMRTPGSSACYNLLQPGMNLLGYLARRRGAATTCRCPPASWPACG